MFELLFKYRYFVFEKGRIALHSPFGWQVAVALAIAAAGFAYFVYRKPAGTVEPVWRWALTALRAASLLVLLLVLMQPVLILHSVVPQQSFVAIAYDTSRSMELRDAGGGASRVDAAKHLLSDPAGPLLGELGRKFKLRYFRFSGEAERTAAFDDPPRHGSRTDLQRALEQVTAELAGVPVAGVILITDGVDNRSTDLASAAGRLRARKIPVYPVGVGSESWRFDSEVVRVSTQPRVLKDSLVEASVSLRAVGAAGRKTRLTVSEGSRILQTEDVVLSGDSEVRTQKVFFRTDQAGPRVFSFKLEPLGGETVPENNERSVLIRVEDEKPAVLYVEGEPRWLYGFLRRASQDDKNLRLVTLLRQADGKYLRQGVESASQLEKGFPVTKQELFGYKALIIGSVEATFFSYDQLRMISDFVGQRGGGLLALGGKSSFSQGGYAGTPLEDLLPLKLERVAQGGPSTFEDLEFKAALAPYGADHPVTRMGTSESETQRRWDAAPSLVGFNRTGPVKPGATTLLEAKVENARGPAGALLVFQRFGRGRTLALTTGSTWRWRMELDHRDNFHETFWKQTLRWLVSDVPDQVQVSAGGQAWAPGETVGIKAEVSDPTFLRINDALVTATIKAPSGETFTIPLQWEVGADGQYSGTCRPLEEGIYELSAEATQGGRSLGTARTSFRVAESNDEFHDAQMNSGLLKRLASESGGRYYTADTVRTLPEDISYVDAGVTRVEEKDLWDAPALFLLLAALLSSEWAVRKWKGLA